jgi:sortase A
VATDEHTVPTLVPVLDGKAVPRLRRGLVRRTLRILSHILLTLGVLAFVWAFVIWKWSDPFTGLYTRYEQGKLRTQYIHVQKQALKTLPVIPRTVPIAKEKHQLALIAARYRAGAKDDTAIGRISVPRLHLNMILLNGTDESSLMRGPGRDPRTYMPGQGQLVYIAGHRTTYLAPFSHIDEMKNGDLITISVPYGKFTYRVYTHVIVPATDLARLNTFGKDLVVLQACHPRFFATHRYLVYGRLVHVAPTRGRPYEIS